MAIEGINSTQQVVNTQKKELAREVEEKQIESKGSTKDIVAALGVLASIGIATVAIIKSKNAKKELQEALKKAEEEKKKLAEEAKKAAEDAKKAAEDINKKVDEAVNKAKEELKTKMPKSGGGGKSGTKVVVIKHEPKPVVEPKPTATHAEPKPVVEPKPEPIVEPKPTATLAEPKPAIEPKPEPIVEPKPTATHAEPKPIVEPKPTATHVEPKPIVEPKPEPIVEPKPTATPAELKPIVEPKPETIVEPKSESVSIERPKKPYTKPEQKIVEIKPEKSAEEIKRQEQIEQAQLDYYQGTDMKEVARNILNEKPVPQPIDVLGNINLSKPLNRMTEKELLFEYKALKDAVKSLSITDPAAKRFLEIKGELINKRAFAIMKDGNIVKRQGVLDEYTKEGLEYLEKQDAEAKRAIKESNTRNAKWLEEQQAKREAEYEQMYLNAEKEKNEDFIKLIEEQDAVAKRAIEESDARNTKWLEEQQAIKQDEYEAMYLNAEREKKIADGAKVLERGNLDVDLEEVAPFYENMIKEGQNEIIFVPRETKLSNAVQKATDYVSERWGKFRGLFGKKKTTDIQPEKPFEPSAEGVAAWAEHLRDMRIEEGKLTKKQVEKQLKDNSNTTPIQEFIDSSIPRKHNKRYHEKLQREYEKELGIKEDIAKIEEVNVPEIEALARDVKPKAIKQPVSKEQKPAVEIVEETKVPKVEPKTTPVVEPKAEAPKVEPKKVEKPVAETVKAVGIQKNGLSEVDSLLVEREALTKSSTSIHDKRIKEINARLEELGAKDSKPNLESNVAKANYDVAYQKAEKEYWQKAAEREESKYQETLKIMQEKNIKPLDIPLEEKQLIKEYLNKMASYRRWNIKDPEYAQKELARANQIKQLFKDRGKELTEPTTEELKLQYELITSEVGIITDKTWADNHARVLKEKTKTLNDLLQTSSEVSKKK